VYKHQKRKEKPEGITRFDGGCTGALELVSDVEMLARAAVLMPKFMLPFGKDRDSQRKLIEDKVGFEIVRHTYPDDDNYLSQKIMKYLHWRFL